MTSVTLTWVSGLQVKTVAKFKRTAAILSHAYVIKTNYLGVGHRNIFRSWYIESQLKDLILAEEGRTWNSSHSCCSCVFGEWVWWGWESNYLALRDIRMPLKCQVMRIAWPGCCRFRFGTGWGKAAQHHSELLKKWQEAQVETAANPARVQSRVGSWEIARLS